MDVVTSAEDHASRLVRDRPASSDGGVDVPFLHGARCASDHLEVTPIELMRCWMLLIKRLLL